MKHLFVLAFFVRTVSVLAAVNAPLTHRNQEAPFCYVAGSSRAWPILANALPPSAQFRFTALRNGVVVATGASGHLSFEGYRVSADKAGKLQIASKSAEDRAEFELRVEVLEKGSPVQQQLLTIRPAPTVKPVAYYADFGDDLINIFGAGLAGGPPILHHQLREGGAPDGKAAIRSSEGILQYDKGGFDQYFRRLQCQGVAREILWLFPFSFITDASAYEADDWREFTQQASALIHSKELSALKARATKLSSWGWLQDLLVFRQTPAMHEALSDSAIEHGITLSVSYRPFEQAGSKYYQLPAFDSDGRFLGNYQPLSTPPTNRHPSQLGFAHYREILKRIGREDDGRIATIEVPRARGTSTFLERYREKGDNLRIVVSDFPPLQSDSFVLVRQAGGSYRLVPYRDIKERAEARRQVVTGFEVREDGDTVKITGLSIPGTPAVILLENPSGQAPLILDAQKPVVLRNSKGVDLGRTANYFSFPEASDEEKATRVGGITHKGEYNPAFFATENSHKLLANKEHQPLDRPVLVIHRGELFSTEMVDYELSPVRANAIRQLKAVLRYPAFRDLYINTRSHTQLAADSRDGADGVKPWAYYMPPRKPGVHLGIDLGYTARSLAGTFAAKSVPTEILSTFRNGEWAGFCQSDDCPHPWRLERNRRVAVGIRLFLDDLRKAFPSTRIRVVLPERKAVAESLAAFQKTQPTDAVTYSAGRYNYIQNIGEGLTLLDLSGTNIETVLLGVGAFVSPPVLDKYLDEALKDVAGNRGSSFAGQRGIMFEGQYGLKDNKGREAREKSMCGMLARTGGLGEVILYEAADWIYRLPWNGFDFLENCRASQPKR